MKKFKERSGPRLGTINFDSNSYPILNPTHHPVVVFYVNNEVWYLNSETYKGIIHDGTILIKDPNGYENLVDTTAINIMDRKEFESFYKKSEFTDLTNVADSKEAIRIYSRLEQNFLDKDKMVDNKNCLTIQRVSFDFKTKRTHADLIYTNKPSYKNKYQKIANESLEAKQHLNRLETNLDKVLSLSEEEFKQVNKEFYTEEAINKLSNSKNSNWPPDIEDNKKAQLPNKPKPETSPPAETFTFKLKM
ncbi:hypothetical protein KQ878_00805 [Mycoplasma zalophidermidis]|uniref:Uncharacterized protein n=2 Tax=Mycoplasma zalophidermidis TaxID=398174 RepID=A0ABS6DS59_9MOLU|nr:hypothetical protein [Mycoplasma zalophidermidis]MBU4693425.1 hypothetical protein [Mycoplasma zalophidermidis]